jgi:hypothetical protein
MMGSKKQPLDPICALCRISLLNFKGVNTKIGIGEHAVNLQDPTVLQGMLRSYYGDRKDDIYELFYLVTHLIAWFLVPVVTKKDIPDPQHEGHRRKGKGENGEAAESLVDRQDRQDRQDKTQDDRFVSDLRKMVRYMCMGLEKLQNTYKTGNVVLTIQYYINLLEDGLNGQFDTKRLPHCLVEDLWIDSPLKQKVKEIWDYERLHRVCTVFDDCFSESQKQFKFKEELINGYLISISNLLTTYEKEFNSHIKQWG